VHELASITDELVSLTAQQSWPGGVRELRNALNRLGALYDPELDVTGNWRRAAQLGDSLLQKRHV
jgi:DNA-binding NtrC family response regulator